jgi:PAS domain S-box-containing protein
MPFPSPSAFAKPHFTRAFLLLLGAWTLFIAGVLGVTEYYSFREERSIALHRAVDSYHKDLSYRRWAVERGGVYVPLNAKTPPNPYLAHLPHRDVTTEQGVRLTLVNPAYMTRMVHELGSESYGLKAHITSLRPIRPENAPDAWERKALETFERGAREQSEVVQDQGKTVLRYMGAFMVDASCLTCHAQQGYKVGDVRGGLSVTIPVGAGSALYGLTRLGVSLLTILAFWLLGGASIWFGVRRFQHSAQDQHRMLADLEDSSTRFRQLFQSSPAPMFIHRSGQLIEVNQAAAQLLDAEEPSQLIGQEFMHFIHPDFRSLVAQRVQEVQATRTPNPLIEEIFLTLRGREVPVEVQSIYLDLPGGPAATLAFAQDLTERKRSQEERQKLEAEIQHAQKLESLGSLAGGIAHDMNNVLAAILGMASLLQIKHEDDPALAKSLGIIEDAAGRGRDLVKGLTDFARKGLQQAQVLDLNALIQKELDLLIRTSRQRFTFEVQLEAGLPPISGEPSTLGSAFMNLCVNAFDAMPRGGTLTVRTRLEGDLICLQVTDTGEGIPAEILPRVTDPFFTTKPPGRGTGLGLAMVYGTVKAHGGTFDIQSEVGKGTQITLRFPAPAAEAASAASDGTTQATMDQPLRILLVDDDELIRSIMPPMLRQLGHQVETASGGLEAVRRLSAGLEADLVILDHNMPGLSGAETLPRLLQLCPTIRVLIATGFQDTELKLLLADFPSVRTLQKPFSLAELRQALRGI